MSQLGVPQRQPAASPWPWLLGLACLGLACGGDGAGNSAPRFEVIHHQVFEVGGLDNRVIVTATDADGDRLSYSLHGSLWVGTDKQEGFAWNQAGDRLPAGMTFAQDPEKAIFSWDPLASQVGLHEVTFVVSDGDDRDEEKITVEVRPSDVAGGGAPEFITPSSYVLQLVQSATLAAVVAVRDDDSARVSLELIGAPEGLSFKTITADGKRGELLWTPTEAQLSARSIYSFLARAEDVEGNWAEQRLRIVIRRKDGGGPRPDCPGELPAVEHSPLRDQFGAADFELKAQVGDDGRIVRVFAAFTTENPQDLRSFESAELEPVEAPDGSYNYRGSLPNRTQPGAPPITYYYYLCALDDDDPAGEDCDHFWCVPEEAVFTFVARPEGGSECADDAREPNDGAGEATPLDGRSLPDLWLCPSDEDWFALDVPENGRVEASILFATADGDLALELQDATGRTLQRSATASDREELSAHGLAAGRYLLRVTGAFAAGSEGVAYALSATASEGGDCAADAGEPNDLPGQASPLAEGSSGPYQLCPGDVDVYRFEATAGEALRLEVLFTHAAGDLDARVLDAASEVLASSTSSSDDERIDLRAPTTGPLYLQVQGFRDARNRYDLVLERPGAGPCPDAALEPNETREQATWLEDAAVDGAICASGPADDLDVYRVYLPAFTGLRLRAEFGVAQGDLDLLLLDAQDRLLHFAESSDDDEVIDFPGLRIDATVYLTVFGYDHARNSYTLSAAPLAFEQRCLPDLAEPNDQVQEPASLRLEEGGLELPGLSLCGDEDWFSVEVPEGAGLLAAIDSDPGRGNLELELRRGDEVLDATAGAHASETVSGEELPAGTYLLRVRSADARPNLYGLELLLF